jgi:hypothetical protein
MPAIYTSPVTPTTSPWTYINTTNRVQYLLTAPASGGAFTLVQEVDEGQLRAFTNVGLIAVRPGMQVKVTYTGGTPTAVLLDAFGDMIYTF